LYITSLYFCFTAITTVGYGDIAATSYTEKIMCIIFVGLGVLFYSFTQGQFIAVFDTYDDQCADIKKKEELLGRI
jgi:Ion channel